MNVSFSERQKFDRSNEIPNECVNTDEIGQAIENCDCDSYSQNHCPEIAPSYRDSDDGNSFTNFYADGVDSEIDLKAIENDCLESSDY